MSIGLLSSVGGSAAGTSLAQTRGSDVDRTQQDTNTQELQAQGQESAEQAAGVGEADGDNHETTDRDADGRRPWEISRRGAQATASPSDADRTPVPDPTGQSGGLLDLSG